MGNPTKDVVRYERYKKVLGVLVAREEFSLDDAKDACADEKPVFVTKVANRLKDDGYVIRNGSKTKPSFQWAQSPEDFNATQWLDQQIYGSQITQTPANDRPRERLLAHGASELRTAELIAILIRSGRPGESALQGGEKVAIRFARHIERLPRAGRAELKSISKAIDVTAYCQIMAGIELGRRVTDASETSPKAERIKSSEDAIRICRRRFARLADDGCREEFHIVTLDTKHQVINDHDITTGILDASLAHPREVFRPAINDSAAAVILVHNHPSGDPTPSGEDLDLTDRLKEAGKVLDIDVLDHIVVARNGAVSIEAWRA